MSALPSLRQLSYLLALHEHGHFGRAAAACFVTQSTLSAGIAELERLLGVVLVERTKRAVRFTAIGQEVAARALGVVRAAEDLGAAVQEASAPLTGALRLAVIPTVAPFLLPRLLPAVAAAWPGLRLSVREMLTGPACDALHRGAADCALLALPAECGDVEVCEIATDRLWLAVRPDAGPVPALPLDEAASARLLLLDDGHCLTAHALTVCAPAEEREAPVVAATLQTLVGLVDAGLGFTLLPGMAVAAGMLDGTGVKAQAIDQPEAFRRVALAWRRGHPRAADLRLLAGTLAACVTLPPPPPAREPVDGGAAD